MSEYIHGGDIYSQPVRLDFSINVNPLGIPEGVKAAAEASIERCGVYPDSRCARLTEALSQKEGVEEKRIVCGNGAADLIFGLALALKPKKALVAAPSFAEYEKALETVGCRTEHFFLTESENFALRPEKVRKALKEHDGEGTEKLGLLFLCSPNNPTGQGVGREDMEQIARWCRQRNIWLAVDQCFEEFLEEPEAYSVVPALKDFPNLVVFKAFTKSFAMAGLRLGYALCASTELAEGLRQVRQPWSVSAVAQAAGLAALKEKDFLRQTRSLIAKERPWLSAQLEKLGMKVYPSQVNYLLFRAPGRENLKEELLKREILIRSCANFTGLGEDTYRVCIRRREENRQLISALKEIEER